MLPILQFNVALRQLIVRSPERTVDLRGIEELNYRLAIFAFGVISLPTFKILLFAHIRIARTASRYGSH